MRELDRCRRHRRSVDLTAGSTCSVLGPGSRLRDDHECGRRARTSPSASRRARELDDGAPLRRHGWSTSRGEGPKSGRVQGTRSAWRRSTSGSARSSAPVRSARPATRSFSRATCAAELEEGAARLVCQQDAAPRRCTRRWRTRTSISTCKFAQRCACRSRMRTRRNEVVDHAVLREAEGGLSSGC